MSANWLMTQMVSAMISAISHLDKEAWAPLTSHQNKIICFQIEYFGCVYFKIADNAIVVLETLDNAHVDTTFSGPLSAYTTMLFGKKSPQHNLHIKGDIDCAKSLYDAWHHLDLDFEGHLAKIMPSSLAHLLCKGLQEGRKSVHEALDHRVADAGAYLQDEINLLVSRNEVEDFYAKIDTLRHDVSRFEAKIHLLTQRYDLKEE